MPAPSGISLQFGWGSGLRERAVAVYLHDHQHLVVDVNAALGEFVHFLENRVHDGLRALVAVARDALSEALGAVLVVVDVHGLIDTVSAADQDIARDEIDRAAFVLRLGEEADGNAALIKQTIFAAIGIDE